MARSVIDILSTDIATLAKVNAYLVAESEQLREKLAQVEAALAGATTPTTPKAPKAPKPVKE